MSITKDTANHDYFIHSAKVAHFCPQDSTASMIKRSRHSLSEALTLYSGQTGTPTFPLHLLVYHGKRSHNLLNYARAHNGLWLHTKVSSHEISYDPFEPGWRTEEKSHRYPGISLNGQHWVPQVPQPIHPDVY